MDENPERYTISTNEDDNAFGADDSKAKRMALDEAFTN